MAKSKQSQPVKMLCRYRVKKGKASEFLAHLKKHWPTLRRAGLASATPAKVQRCEDKAGNVAFVETFAWKNAAAPGSAHQSPDVMAIWEPMGSLCEDMEFWQVDPVAMPFAKA